MAFGKDHAFRKLILESVKASPAALSNVTDYIKSQTTGRIGPVEIQRIETFLKDFCDSGNLQYVSGRYMLTPAKPQSKYELGDIVRLDGSDLTTDFKGTGRKKFPVSRTALYLVVYLRPEHDRQSNPYNVVNLEGISKGSSGYSVRHDQIIGVVKKDPYHPWIWDKDHKRKYRIEILGKFFDWSPFVETE